MNVCEWVEAAEVGALPGLDLGRKISYPSHPGHSRVFKWSEQFFNEITTFKMVLLKSLKWHKYNI